MNTVQIYDLANQAVAQSMGKLPIQAIDTNSFISLGKALLNSTDNVVDNFTNVLVQRIARTIISFRMYESVFKPIVFDDLRWGGLVQKIKTEMPEAVEDEAYDLVDGESVDMYVVKKPKTKQKFFVNRTPYSFFITIQRWQIKHAFLSEAAFGSFVASIFGEVRNKMELTFERLGYLAVANFIGNLKPTQIVDLVTMYNTATGSTLNKDTALLDSAFMRYGTAQMNMYRKRLANYSVSYNAEGEERHTPTKYQRFITLTDFEQYMETVVQWEAFHEQYVKTESSIVIPHWQSEKNPFDIIVTNENGQEVTVKNIIALIHDRDALGTYRKEQEVLTTPVNARGRYTNTFWHEEQMWFNDLAENGVVFTLN